MKPAHFRKVEKIEGTELAHWLASDTWPYYIIQKPEEEQVLERIRNGEFFGEGEENFWILLGEIKVGLIEIFQLNDYAPMFNIRIKSTFRGQGLGGQGLKWMTAHIFEKYPDKRRIEGQTREDNISMRKIFNRCGYVKEAYYRFASPTEDGGRVASVAYGILREDWVSGRLTPVKWVKDEYFNGDCGL